MNRSAPASGREGSIYSFNSHKRYKFLEVIRRQNNNETIISIERVIIRVKINLRMQNGTLEEACRHNGYYKKIRKHDELEEILNKDIKLVFTDGFTMPVFAKFNPIPKIEFLFTDEEIGWYF